MKSKLVQRSSKMVIPGTLNLNSLTQKMNEEGVQGIKAANKVFE